MANLLPPPAQIAGNHITSYEGFFQVADVWKTGNIAAPEAAAFLKKSGLSDVVLSKIWDLCDPDAKGYLDKRGFFMSLKLIALVQNGQEATLGNLAMTVPPPKLGDVVPVLFNVTGDWRITSSDKVKSDQIFDTLQPINNKVSGDKVKPVLLNSNLPVDVLSNIWDLSDIDKDGQLDRDEFAVAMYLIYRALDKEPVPATLPPDLVPPSKRRRQPGAPPSVAVGIPPPAYSLTSASATGIPSAVAASTMPSSSVSSSIAGGAWVVLPAEKAKYDSRFIALDTNCDGLVNGLEVKDIFMQSGLHQNMLAHIWGLCDTHNIGSLNADQFALAMHFIEQKITRNVDPPQVLAADMITPSMRMPEVAVSSEFAKEMEIIEKEIEELKREKNALEADKQQKEADIRIRNGEVQTLQKELDAIAATNQQLERQKAEAQKRLDELDDKKAKCQDIVRDLKERIDDKQRALGGLKERYGQQERLIKEQEEEGAKLRVELAQLTDEQRRLEQQLEASRQRADEQRRLQAELAPQVAKVKAQIEKLQIEQAKFDEDLKQYNALMAGDPDAKEPAADIAAATVMSTAPAPGWPVAAAALVTSGTSVRAASPSVLGSAWGPPSVTISTAPVQVGTTAAARDAFGGAAVFDAFKEDPFHGSDPFKDAAVSDPFKEDPFKADLFTKDPFQGDDPFKNDPFVKSMASDPFASSTKKSEASSSLDPFGGSTGGGGNFGSHPGSSVSVSGPRDAFDPFSSSSSGGGVGVTAKSSMGADPFATDPFSAGSGAPAAEASALVTLPAPAASASSSARTPAKRAGTVAPPRPAPPPAAATAQKKAEQQAAFGFPLSASGSASTAVAVDPFGGADPFAGGGSTSVERDPFASASKPLSRDPFASTTGGGSSSALTSSAAGFDPFGSGQAKSAVGKDPFSANFADFTWEASSSSGWPSSGVNGETALVAGSAKPDPQQKPQFGSPLVRTTRQDSTGSAGNLVSPTRIETDI